MSEEGKKAENHWVSLMATPGEVTLLGSGVGV